MRHGNVILSNYHSKKRKIFSWWWLSVTWQFPLLVASFLTAFLSGNDNICKKGESESEKVKEKIKTIMGASHFVIIITIIIAWPPFSLIFTHLSHFNPPPLYHFSIYIYEWVIVAKKKIVTNCCSPSRAYQMTRQNQSVTIISSLLFLFLLLLLFPPIAWQDVIIIFIRKHTRTQFDINRDTIGMTLKFVDGKSKKKKKKLFKGYE